VRRTTRTNESPKQGSLLPTHLTAKWTHEDELLLATQSKVNNYHSPFLNFSLYYARFRIKFGWP